MEDIRAWFNGKKKYEEGVALYLKHGIDPQLIRLFTAEAYSDFKMKKLTSALDDLLSILKETSTAPVNHQSKTSPGNKEPKSPPVINKNPVPQKKWRPEGQMDEMERSLYLQWKKTYGEMINLMARVGDIARAGKNDPNKKAEAGRMALNILELDYRCDIIYYNRDHYLEHKRMPEEKKPVDISLDPALWHTRLESHKRYMRRFINDLKKDPSNTSKAELLLKHEWAVSEYKKLLKIN